MLQRMDLAKIIKKYHYETVQIIVKDCFSLQWKVFVSPHQLVFKYYTLSSVYPVYIVGSVLGRKFTS